LIFTSWVQGGALVAIFLDEVMTDDARRTGPAVEAHFQFLMWLMRAVDKFEKTGDMLGGGTVPPAPAVPLEGGPWPAASRGGLAS